MSENGGQVNGIESPSPFKVPLQVHQDEGTVSPRSCYQFYI